MSRHVLFESSFDKRIFSGRKIWNEYWMCWLLSMHHEHNMNALGLIGSVYQYVWTREMLERILLHLIFMKFDTNVVPLEATPNSIFLISCSATDARNGEMDATVAPFNIGPWNYVWRQTLESAISVELYFAECNSTTRVAAWNVHLASAKSVLWLGYRLDDRGSVPGMAQHPDSGTHSASYSVGAWVLSSGAKLLGREANHSP
jgi:hypothetical protein